MAVPLSLRPVAKQTRGRRAVSVRAQRASAPSNDVLLLGVAAAALLCLPGA